MCVLWELRGALRAGDIWLEGSRHYANPETYLIPRNQWTSLRAETCRMVQVPESGTERLREHQLRHYARRHRRLWRTRRRLHVRDVEALLLELESRFRLKHVTDADLLGMTEVAVDQPGARDEQRVTGEVIGGQHGDAA